MALDGSLAGKVAIVTGAAQGVGESVAHRLADAGAAVVMNDLDLGLLRAAVAGVAQRGGQVQAFPGDVTALDFPDLIVSHTLDAFGAVDIVVNNAGFTWDAAIHRMTDEHWASVLEIHMTGPFRLLRRLAPVFRDQSKRDRASGVRRHRKVVNVTSASGLFGLAGQANYASAKAGLDGLTRSLSREWGPYLVNVNSVALGLVKTRLTSPDGGHVSVGSRSVPIHMDTERWRDLEARIPLGGRAATPEQAAGAVYLLCSPDADYVTGQTVLCAGGMAL